MRRVASFLALLALSWCAFAGDLDASKASLGSALTTRIAAIGVPPAKSALARELKHLTKAGTALGRFAGTLDATGIIALVATGRSVFKSQTADATIAAEVSTMLGCVIDALTAQEAQLLSDATQMFAPSDQIKFRNLLASARQSVADAEAIGNTDAKASFAKISEAFSSYAKAGRLVQRVVDRQQNQALPILRGGTLSVQNRNGQLLKVTAISFDVFYLPTAGGEQRVKALWADHNVAAGSPDLPYVVPPFVQGDPSTEFDMYPPLYQAVSAAIGATPDGSVKGVIKFTSNKHGTVLIPVDQNLTPP